MHNWLKFLVAVGATLLLAACGEDGKKNVEGPKLCVEGEVAACTCPGGRVGEGTCDASGTFGRCSCEDEGAGGGAGGDGGGAGEGGSGGDGPEPDPCGDVPEEGICVGRSLIHFCSEEGSEREISSRQCEPWERCEADGEGVAGCVDDTGCEAGASTCRGEAEIGHCAEDGSWSWDECSTSCRDSPLGAFCAPTFPTSDLTGTLSYEARLPDTQFREWGEVFRAPAAGLVVVSLHDGSPIDAGLVASDGGFRVKVAATPVEGDELKFYAVGSAAGRAGVAFAVGYPGPTTGERRVGTIKGSEASYWNWSLPVPIETGSEWLITEADGSPALRLFDWLNRTWDQNVALHGVDGLFLVMWWAAATTWDCGACFSEEPITLGGDRFETQIWMSGDPVDQTHWSDAVTLHELGHWAMSSFGVSPEEGGAHCLGVPTMPGLAWSEGWATFHSTDLRNDPMYYDKQDGTLFWFDIARATYGWGMPFEFPVAGGDLMQRVDENWVAASLWHISRHPSVEPEQVHRALSSDRMRTRPFARGYTTKRFGVDWRCRPVGVSDTRRSAPMFADFLDALICSDVPASALWVVDPYPYPANEPICL